jgi:hypothetical protein
VLGNEDRVYPDDLRNFMQHNEENEMPRIAVVCSRGG